MRIRGKFVELRNSFREMEIFGGGIERPMTNAPTSISFGKNVETTR